MQKFTAPWIRCRRNDRYPFFPRQDKQLGYSKFRSNEKNSNLHMRPCSVQLHAILGTLKVIARPNISLCEQDDQKGIIE